MNIPRIWMIATDGSHYAELSTQYASKLFRLMPEKPDVWIVNVVSDPGGVGRDGLAREIGQAEKMLEKISKGFSDDGSQHENVQTLVEVGDPRKKLVEVLKRLDVEHLFMGGADFSTGSADLTSGGITNYMLHHLKGMATIVK